jgi:DeoR/GlpR family transcriptional regulator of sugar metabolism
MLREGGVYGPDTVEFIRRFKANKAFIGAGGVTAQGVTDADSSSCSVKRAMMERSDLTVLLVDRSKYDLAQFERVCALSDIDQLVCEAAPPKRLAASLKSAGVLVIVAKE